MKKKTIVHSNKQKRYNKIQLLLKSLNTPADVLSQLCQSISLILTLYACSTSTILIASVQRPWKMKSEFLTMKESLTKKKAMVSLYPNMKLHFTLVFKLLSSNCIINKM